MHPVACDQRTCARASFALRLRGVLPRGDAHQATLELLEPAAVTTGTGTFAQKRVARRTVCSVCRARFKSGAHFGGRISAASRSA
jgi:hypothetical protein